MIHVNVQKSLANLGLQVSAVVQFYAVFQIAVFGFIYPAFSFGYTHKEINKSHPLLHVLFM
jgi:hypothetical protein